MRLSVVIPTYRRPDSLARCLQAVLAQSRTADEVIVVSHEEDEETARVLEAAGASSVPVLNATVSARSVLASMGVGASAARGDVLAFTDDDACPRPDWAARLLSPYADPAVGAVGGRDVIHQHSSVVEGKTAHVGRVRWFGRTIGNHHLGIGEAREVDLLKGVNISLRRALWAFDPRLRGLGAEPHWELDLLLRLRSRGWRVVYDPRAVVDHYVAQRIDERQRDDVSLAYVHDSAHNETYALLKWSPAWRRPIAVLYSVLVGSRTAPGLAAAADRWARGVRRDRLKRDLGAALVGRRAALRSYGAASRCRRLGGEVPDPPGGFSPRR
jgi:cellulose synthase/poly-beta-1,6-N-acetylglucosamine synthase-like glycosyltransferase